MKSRVTQMHKTRQVHGHTSLIINLPCSYKFHAMINDENMHHWHEQRKIDKNAYKAIELKSLSVNFPRKVGVYKIMKIWQHPKDKRETAC